MRGYAQFDEEIFTHEGLNRKNEYEKWKKDTAKKLKNIDSYLTSAYKISAISHATYFTKSDHPPVMKDLYVDKYIKSCSRLSDADPSFWHILWTNNVKAIPDSVKSLKGIKLQSCDEFKEHELYSYYLNFLRRAQNDARVFVEASDVARVMALQKYGGLYHDLDYEIYDAKIMINYMKSFPHFNAQEADKWDSCVGNALIATTKDHPILNKFAFIISRNLKFDDQTPIYVKYPKNNFDGVMFQTGPVAITMATYLAYSDDCMIFPDKIIYNCAFARSGANKLPADLPTFSFEGMKIKTIGGDLFSGNWVHSGYTNDIHYDYVPKYGEKPIAEFVKRYLQKNNINMDKLKVSYAAKRGHFEMVKYLVEKGGKIDDNAVWGAAQYGYFEVVKYLVEKGGKIDDEAVKDAAVNGHFEMVKYLVEKGCKINDNAVWVAARNGHFDDNAVWVAARNGHFDVVKYLVEKGAKIETYAVLGAAENGRFEIVKYLVEKGGKIDDEAVEDATRNGHTDIAEFLTYCIEHDYGCGCTQAWDARIVAKYLQENDIKMDELTVEYAAKNGHFEMVKYLVEQGGKIDDEAVKDAAKNGHFELVKYLVEKGGTICYWAVVGAARNGHFEVVKYLVEKGGKINYYAVWVAAKYGHFEVVKYLIEKGGKIDDDAVEDATKNGHTDIAEFLQYCIEHDYGSRCTKAWDARVVQVVEVMGDGSSELNVDVI